MTTRRQAGFTLVEVVVALSVLSLIMLATITALRTFANTQQSLDRMMTRVDEVRSVSTLLRDLVDSTARGLGGVEGLTLGGGPSDAAWFGGTAAELVFKANIMFGENFGGQYLLRLAREDGELVLRWQESRGDARNVSWEETPSRVMVQGLQLFEVAYRGSFGEDWVPEWPAGGAVPASLRIRLRSQDRFWPELVMGVPR